jgi:hypothetical protein
VAAFSGGRCGVCDGALQEDDEIVKFEDEWCHVACAEENGCEVDRS